MKKFFKPIDVLLFFSSKSAEELQSIPDIGPEVARSIFEYFHDRQNEKLVEKFNRVGVKIRSNNRPSSMSRKLVGKVLVLTGTLSSMTRDEAKEKILQLGGNVSESVSSKTAYLVIGDQPGSKYEQAKKLGVKIIREQKFLTMLK